MRPFLEKLQIITSDQNQMLDITNLVSSTLKKSVLKDGICVVFVPHTTAAVTINENADPDVKTDMIMELKKIVPQKDNYRHFEGNSAAHIKATLTGQSAWIIVENGELQLGTWQGIYFCEFDGPRRREIWIKFLGD